MQLLPLLLPGIMSNRSSDERAVRFDASRPPNRSRVEKQPDRKAPVSDLHPPASQTHKRTVWRRPMRGATGGPQGTSGGVRVNGPRQRVDKPGQGSVSQDDLRHHGADPHSA